MHFLTEYGMFLAKTLTLVLALLFTVIGVVVIASKDKEKQKIKVKKLNKHFHDLGKAIKRELLHKTELKKLLKELKKAEKEAFKSTESKKDRIFVLDFIGDMKASAVDALREEVTAILQVAQKKDEVVIRLESPGGVVHGYGLAASQVHRIKEQGIPLTICVDKVAASGGYMMACIATKIIAAPFAIIGSIGVIAQLPNFHKLLKKNNIDFEQVMAGEYKRTLTVFGENTKEAREKFQLEIDAVHQQFKKHIALNRPSLDIDKVATGEHWLAIEAKDLHLVDALQTSDDYLLKASKNADIYHIKYAHKKKLGEKLAEMVQLVLRRTVSTAYEELDSSRYS